MKQLVTKSVLIKKVGDREREIASSLRRLANLIEGSVPLIEPRTTAIIAPHAGPVIVRNGKPILKIGKLRHKSARAATVNKLINSNKVLKDLGAKSTGVDLEKLADCSKYYNKAWRREVLSADAPASDLLMKVLHARQRELGVTFRNTTDLFDQKTADNVIEALKEVGRALLRMKKVTHDTVDPLV